MSTSVYLLKNYGDKTWFYLSYTYLYIYLNAYRYKHNNRNRVIFYALRRFFIRILNFDFLKHIKTLIVYFTKFPFVFIDQPSEHTHTPGSWKISEKNCLVPMNVYSTMHLHPYIL